MSNVTRGYQDVSPQAVKVSVIITTWRRPEQLRLCLEALKRQIYHPYEVIVTEDDDKSGNGTASDTVLFDYIAATLTKARYITHPRTLDGNGNGIWDEPQTINAAVAAATGDVVQILQDDFIIPPDFLLWLVRSIDRSSIIYPLIEYTTHDRFTLADLDSMTRLTHIPDAEPRWQQKFNNGRSLMREFTEWTMAEGVGWAFYRDAWIPIDPHFVGYGYGEQDWALRQRLRGYHLYVQPLMRAWLRDWPGVAHPTEEEVRQMVGHQKYMCEKWGENIWQSNPMLPGLPFPTVAERIKELRGE